MAFLRPALLVLVLLLPLLVAGGIALTVRRRRWVARALGDPALVERLTGADLRGVPWRRVALLLPAAALLGAAAADPRWGRERVEGGGAQVALVLDASASMLAEDVPPSRLERERTLARRLLRAFPESRMGLVAFAGRGYALAPLTADPGALELYVDALSPQIATQGGSSLASAIRQGTNLLLGGDSLVRRVMVLVSDGEALEERAEVMLAAERAEEWGVVIHTVGIGTAQGARVPDLDPRTGERRGWKQDPQTREVVVSRLDEPLLREVARITGGRYFRAGEVGVLVREVRSGRGGAAVYAPGEGVRYGWFLAAALLLIALDTALDARARRRETMPGPGVALLLALALAGCGSPGSRLYREGEYARAAEAYREARARGDRSARTRYNLGTALLRLERYAEARGHLEAAAAAGDSTVRQRASYNAGNAELEPVFRGRTPEPARREALSRAVARYRAALLLAPDDLDAKWNLELAQRLLEREARLAGAGGGGGGGGGDEESPAPEPPADAPRSAAGGGISRSEAERLLAGAEAAERAVRREEMRRDPRHRGGRDW